MSIVAEKSGFSLASCLHFGHFDVFSVIVAENNCNSLATLHLSHIYSKHSPLQSAHSPNQRRKIWHFFVKVSRKSWRYLCTHRSWRSTPGQLLKKVAQATPKGLAPPFCAFLQQTFQPTFSFNPLDVAEKSSVFSATLSQKASICQNRCHVAKKSGVFLATTLNDCHFLI